MKNLFQMIYAGYTSFLYGKRETSSIFFASPNFKSISGQSILQTEDVTSCSSFSG